MHVCYGVASYDCHSRQQASMDKWTSSHVLMSRKCSELFKRCPFSVSLEFVNVVAASVSLDTYRDRDRDSVCV